MLEGVSDEGIGMRGTGAGDRQLKVDLEGDHLNGRVAVGVDGEEGVGIDGEERSSLSKTPA